MDESSAKPVDQEQWDNDGSSGDSTGSAGAEAHTDRAVSDTAAPADAGPPVESRKTLRNREAPRSSLERLLVRLIATCGVVGIGVAIAAVLVSNKTQGWVVGLVVSIVSVILAAVLWSSRLL